MVEVSPSLRPLLVVITSFFPSCEAALIGPLVSRIQREGVVVYCVVVFGPFIAWLAIYILEAQNPVFFLTSF